MILTPERQQALADYLLALADDELILAHRNSEWTGHGPILEEDIAFTNIALDEMGHAKIWYGLVHKLTGDDPDRLVFFRDAADYRNVQMVELPKGDWAFSLLRQYLFDTAETARLPYLAQSSYPPIAAAAAKIRPEEIYHLRHTQSWVKRLGLGTDESNRRMQNGLNDLWPYAQQMFAPLPGEDLLAAAGIVGAGTAVHAAWLNVVTQHLTDSGLQIPANDQPPTNGRANHTSHLDALLADMQLVARLDPKAKW